jgi:hypothetical protein
VLFWDKLVTVEERTPFRDGDGRSGRLKALNQMH